MTKFFTRAIGPKEAEELLAHNYDKNRNVRKMWVKALANMMKQGQFIAQNGDVIRIGHDGTLYDGQHRLMAVIESGTTQYFDFAEIDAPKAAFLTMDNGAKRSAADFVESTDKNTRAAVALAMVCIENGHGTITQTIDRQMLRTMRPNRIEIVEYANANADKVEHVMRLAKKMRSSIGAGAVQAYAMFIYIAMFCEEGNDVASFVEDVCATAPESPTSIAFVKAVSRAFLSGMRPNNHWLVSRALTAYSHFASADGVTSLANTQKWLNKFDKMLQARRAELHGEE